MIALDAAKAAILLFVVAIIQVSLLSSVDVYGGVPNLLLVTHRRGGAPARLGLRRARADSSAGCCSTRPTSRRSA